MITSNLILHCGARSIDRSTLSAIPCPEATETWFPIPHITLVNEVEKSLAKSNMRIVNEAYGVTKDNARMFGLLQVANCKDTADYAYVIGVRGSHNKSLSRGLAIGNSVFCCDNLSFSSEIVIHRKSTKRILDDLPVMVDTAIGKLSSRWNSQSLRIESYKNKEIGNKDVAHLLLEMAGEVFPAQRISDIYKEFKSPRHAEFQKGTVWAMFNAVTEYLKPRSDESKASGLWTLPSRTGRLYKVCDDFSGLQIDTNVEETSSSKEPVNLNMN